MTILWKHTEAGIIGRVNGKDRYHIVAQNGTNEVTVMVNWQTSLGWTLLCTSPD